MLARQKRHPAVILGSILSVVAAAAAAAVITGGLALAQTVANAATINNITAAVANISLSNRDILALQHEAIIAIQHQVDLLGLEMEDMWVALKQGCDERYNHLPICVTPVSVNTSLFDHVNNTKYKRLALRNWMYQTYNSSYTNFMMTLQEQIDHLSTIKAQDISSSFTDFVSGVWTKLKSLFDPTNIVLILMLIVLIICVVMIYKCCISPRLRRQERFQHLAYAALSQQADEDDDPNMIMMALRRLTQES